MNLDRPLFVFDLESTGADPATDRICQIAYAKLLPDGSFEAKTRLINPTIHIPAEATVIHRITDEMVANEPKFHQVAKSLHALIEGCDIGGYNIAGFDIELLWEEYYRAGITWDTRAHKVVDALAIWRKMMPRKLIDAVNFFCPDSGIAEEDLHDATIDVGATVLVAKAQFSRWDLTIDQADEASRRTIAINGEEMERIDLGGALARRADGEIVFTHKKVRGLPVTLDRKYAGWILHNDGFGANTKLHLRDALGMPRASVQVA